MLFRSPWTLYKAVCLGCYENHVRDHREACMAQDKVFYFFKSQKWLLMYLEYLKFFALEDHPWDLVGIIKKDGGGLMEWRRNEG